MGSLCGWLLVVGILAMKLSGLGAFLIFGTVAAIVVAGQIPLLVPSNTWTDILYLNETQMILAFGMVVAGILFCFAACANPYKEGACCRCAPCCGGPIDYDDEDTTYTGLQYYA
ncbi:hypothetical protein KIPB_004700 [Kipferlia bialata]|uniref:Uncharacterized protein n=1 Tax=Kipferlia bialata TaxID=797122 RepID=A0A9K3CXD8_9EUKA|nr:hypothetical protein KIPB_004700 [Kipferlia bialata]|eukprot:g4700.t1